MSFKKLLVATLAVCSAICMAPQTLNAQQAMNNDAVIKLVKAGLSEDLIISTINAQPGAYDTTTDGLIALKKAGVTDKVVGAIVRKGSEPTSATMAPIPSTTEVQTTNPDNPAAPHEEGVYIFRDSSPAGAKMIALKPSLCTKGKVSGVFSSVMTYGIAKVKEKDVVRGAHADLRITDSQPTFYFYFEDPSAILNSHASISLGPSMGRETSPIQFLLQKFDIHGDTREVVTSSSRLTSESGEDVNSLIGFTYTKLRPGVFKVTLNAPLSPGEYGFVEISGNSVFDFSKN